MAVASPVSCIFCQITRGSSASTTLLHADDKVVAFQDIKPSALRHYLVIPVKHISTVKNLSRSTEDFSLVIHMLEVGQTLLNRDAPDSKYRIQNITAPLCGTSFLKQPFLQSQRINKMIDLVFINLPLTASTICTFIVWLFLLYRGDHYPAYPYVPKDQSA